MVIKSSRLIMTVSCHEKTMTMCKLVVTSNSKSKSMFLKLFMIKTSKVASAARAHSVLIMKNLKIVSILVSNLFLDRQRLLIF